MNTSATGTANWTDENGTNFSAFLRGDVTIAAAEPSVGYPGGIDDCGVDFAEIEVETADGRYYLFEIDGPDADSWLEAAGCDWRGIEWDPESIYQD